MSCVCVGEQRLSVKKKRRAYALLFDTEELV